MITLFRVVLLCGLFGMIVATFKDNITHSCVFGVHSVSLILFTSEDPQGKKVERDKISCKSFDLSNRVIFLVHGFLANPYGTNITDLIVVLIQKGYTVFALDWSDAACTNDRIKFSVLYLFASKNIHKVSNYLVSFVRSVANCNVSLENIILMGHSLGANIICLAAKKFFDSKKEKKLLAISIDPAYPADPQHIFYKDNYVKFCKEYAKRAVCLHTSCVGMHESVAHLDLWFNDGNCQPYCVDSKIDSKFCLKSCECSHQIAYIYMATLVDNFSYKGVHIPPKTKDSWLSSFYTSMSRCPSNRANYTSINNRILDSNDTLMGDYCVFVSKEYPYTGDNFSCTEVAANSKH